MPLQPSYISIDFTRKYGEQIRKTTFKLSDAVTVWSVCETAWNLMETVLFKNAEKTYFYKRTDLITFQGKQAERCMILKHNENEDCFYINFNDMQFPLIVKKDDVFIKETLSSVAYYIKNGAEIDLQKPNKQDCDRFFHEFFILHNRCIEEIKKNRKVVMNSGISFKKEQTAKKLA